MNVNDIIVKNEFHYFLNVNIFKHFFNKSMVHIS